MILFAIMTPGDNAGLEDVLKTNFAQDYIKIGLGQYIVAGRSNAIELSNQLGITTGANGSGIVVFISGYYGRADKNVWDWMAAKAVAP